MRILHTADLHVGQTSFGYTPAQHEAMLDFIAVTAEEWKVDAVLVAGDLFHMRQPPPETITPVVRWIRRLAAYATVIVGPGNHDGPSSMHDPSTKTAAWLKALRLKNVRAYPDPTVDRVVLGSGEELYIASLPYPHKRSFASLPHGLSLEEQTTLVGERIETVIADMRARVKPDYPVVFMGHLTVLGATLGEERSMMPGWDASIRADALADFTYSALGHIHVDQMVTERAYYSGSVERHTFDQPPQDKVVLVVDIEPEGVTVGRVATPARTFLTIDTVDRSLFEGGIVGGTIMTSEGMAYDVEGAVVQAVIHAPGSGRVPATVIRDVERQLRSAGAAWVRVVATRTDLSVESRQRIQMDPATDDLDALSRYLVARGLDPARYLPAARELLGDTPKGDTDG